MPPSASLRADALAIWNAAIDAVRSDRLVRENVSVEGDSLRIADERVSLAATSRIAVVGAGKAGAGMAAGLEEALGPELLREKRVSGWVNVPADCVRPLRAIHLHPARPAGVNEPTEDGVHGTMRILEIVESLGPTDLCICLLSGGGSALLPAPAAGLTLSDKQAVTRHLSAAGANIEQLNTVRKQLSRVKGGGLARACKAGRLIALIISDVPGDPLDVIASGPTVVDTTTPQDALRVLEQFGLDGVPSAVTDFLRRHIKRRPEAEQPTCRVTNIVVGNNARAVDAAGAEAVRRGYSPAMLSSNRPEGPAEEIGEQLAMMARQMLESDGPDCLITGGEPTVKLVAPELRGKGGRNQQLVLAALLKWFSENRGTRPLSGLCLLSGGTDGEDGPTDAAGALLDEEVVRRWIPSKIDTRNYLERNDAYHFFQAVDGLIKTGPTHTNVCDVRVLLVRR